MGASVQNIVIEQGATFPREFKIESNSLPVDLTGDTFRGMIRETVSAAAALASFTFTLKNQGTNPGEVFWTMDAATTAAIPVNASTGPVRTLTEYCYDVEWVRADGTVLRIFEGKCTISPEATK